MWIFFFIKCSIPQSTFFSLLSRPSVLLLSTIFTDAVSKENAEKVANAAIKTIGVICGNLEVNPYHKGGFTCSFESDFESEDWGRIILQTIGLAQSIGYAYILYGDIANELDMWSNESSVSGVTNIQVIAIKKGPQVTGEGAQVACAE